jgi:hypothetical protein
MASGSCQLKERCRCAGITTLNWQRTCPEWARDMKQPAEPGSDLDRAPFETTTNKGESHD